MPDDAADDGPFPRLTPKDDPFSLLTNLMATFLYCERVATERRRMTFETLDRTDLTELVASRLRAAILHGEYAPGDLLPPERDLAEQLGVNRHTLRLGLQKVESLGLVERRQGSGCRVLDYKQHATFDALQFLLLRPDGALDPDVARSLLDVIRLLYSGATDVIIERASDSDLDTAEATLDQLRTALAAGDLAAIVDTERAFHLQLFRGSHSVGLQLLLNTLYGAIDNIPVLRQGFLLQYAAQLAASPDAPWHARYLAAVRARNPRRAQTEVRALLGLLDELVPSFLRSTQPGAERSELRGARTAPVPSTAKPKAKGSKPESQRS